VAHEHNRTGQRPQEFGEVRRVAREIAKRVAESDGGEPAVAQGANLGVEACGIGPRAVNEDDRRLALIGLGGHVSSSGVPCVLDRRAESPPRRRAITS
jgi:hypothetical protein